MTCRHLAGRAVSARPAVALAGRRRHAVRPLWRSQGTLLDPKQLPPLLVKAVLATEDRRFYTHFGVDPMGLAARCGSIGAPGGAPRAALPSPSSSPRNLFLTPDKTVKRKVQEALLALWLERSYGQGADPRGLSQPHLFRRRHHASTPPRAPISASPPPS